MEVASISEKYLTERISNLGFLGKSGNLFCPQGGGCNV